MREGDFARRNTLAGRYSFSLMHRNYFLKNFIYLQIKKIRLSVMRIFAIIEIE